MFHRCVLVLVVAVCYAIATNVIKISSNTHKCHCSIYETCMLLLPLAIIILSTLSSTSIFPFRNYRWNVRYARKTIKASRCDSEDDFLFQRLVFCVLLNYAIRISLAVVAHAVAHSLHQIHNLTLILFIKYQSSRWFRCVECFCHDIYSNLCEYATTRCLRSSTKLQQI